MFKSYITFIVLVALLAFTITSCKTKPKQDQEVKTVIRKGNFTNSVNTSDWTINSATVKDSILFLDISYIPPCSNHSFDLIADGKMSKGIPPQISIELVHNIEKKTYCKNSKKRREVLRFNINPLRVNGQSKIILVLNDGKLVEFNYFPFVSID